MNRTKSILLGATTLAIPLLAVPQAAQAQSTGAVVVFLPAAPESPVDSGTHAAGISADGSIVAGNDDAPVLSSNIVVWVNGVPRTIVVNQPTTARPIPRGFSVDSISGNGLTITGHENDSDHRSMIWTQATGAVYFPNPTAGNLINFDTYVNSNGTYFAVSGRPNPTLPDGSTNPLSLATPDKAYRYSSAGGYENLGNFGATWNMRAAGISGDGGTIAGNAFDKAPGLFPNDEQYRQAAFRWTTSAGLSRLFDLSASPQSGRIPGISEANGISRDGSTIVGASRGNDGFVQAVYWRPDGIHALGFLPGAALPTATLLDSNGSTHALAANADGSIIVGRSIGNFTLSAPDLAWRWTATSGMQDLNVIARNASINLNGFTLIDAVGISDNGQFITGNASNATQSLGYVLQLAQVTQSRLIVTIRLPGVTLSSIVNQSFSTQVDGLLNGRSVFTRTVTDPITGAGGVTALADARAALQVGSGLRRVVIGAPTLISNTTTVTGTTNAVVDVASGTSTSTASVNIFGPATVATGSLGTCATPAANNVNPTGCSLPGTPVNVDAGILNSNVFTNTLNTVTPQTTPTVNQLISAKWQVSASAGNQFGTVHALAGVAAFDRGDRLIGQLLGMGGAGQNDGASRVTRAAMPMRDASALGGEGSGLTMFGGYFGNWSRIDADASVPVANVRGNTNGFVLGLEKALGDARIGAAVDHGTSDYSVRDPVYAETLALKHTQLALYVGWNSGGFSLDGAASYGFGTARTTLSTPTTPATGSRDVKSWSLGAQAGYTVPLGRSASVELVGGVRHTSAKLSRFTETGGPSPLIGLAETVNRTRIYGGIEAEARIDMGGLTLTPRLHARLARDSGDASGTADLVFASAPNGPVLTAVGPGVGRTVAELGGSLDAALSDTVHLWVGYDGSFRDGARTHAAKAGLTVAF
jgi:uncharacterized membrane protein